MVACRVLRAVCRVMFTMVIQPSSGKERAWQRRARAPISISWASLSRKAATRGSAKSSPASAMAQSSRKEAFTQNQKACFTRPYSPAP